MSWGFVRAANAVDGITLQNIGGTLSIKALSAALMGPVLDQARRQASGSSSSGSPGTLVCELAAAVGNVLVGWVCYITTGAAGTMQVIITYTDDTTIAFTSGSGAQAFLACAGGIMQPSGVVSAGSDKDVKKIRVETAGAGITARAAAIEALEVIP